MRIKKIEYYDKELNWRLNPVDFSEQNLALLVPVIILISSTTSGWNTEKSSPERDSKRRKIVQSGKQNMPRSWNFFSLRNILTGLKSDEYGLGSRKYKT